MSDVEQQRRSSERSAAPRGAVRSRLAATLLSGVRRPLLAALLVHHACFPVTQNGKVQAMSPLPPTPPPLATAMCALPQSHIFQFEVIGR